MNYEKKYKEALERARIWQNHLYDTNDKDYAEELNYIFPELKESEDEKIRKEIIKAFKTLGEGKIPLITNYTDILAWLEKQGEPYGQRENCSDCQFNYVGECKGSCQMKRDEQKSTDKVKPKFKIGDWITDGQLICKVLSVTSKSYELHLYDDDYCHFETDVQHVDKQYHLWTIQDAKNGDILIYNGSIFVFNEIYENNLIYYGIYEHNKFHNDKYYSFLDLNTIDINNIHPATKEQRDLLFTKMKEAGWEFDFDKKELKKIEYTEWHKEDEQNLNACLGYIPVEFLRRWLQNIVHAKYNKPAWSEEDERAIGIIKISLEHPYDMEGKWDRKFALDWLKSLKGRLQSKQEQNNKKDEYEKLKNSSEEITKNKENAKDFLESSGIMDKDGKLAQQYRLNEEDEVYYNDICEILTNLLCSKKANINKNAVQKDINWFQSIKPQNRWKPSDEQMKALANALSLAKNCGEESAFDLRTLYENLKKL